MDTAATLDQYTQDVANLPAELHHLLAELGTRDASMYEAKKKLNAKDAMIHKFIRQNGSMTKFPKEGQLYPKIREEFDELIEQQKEKVVLANTGLFLTAKHFVRLEADLEKLKSEGLLALEDDQEINLDSDAFSSNPGSRLGSVGLLSAAGAPYAGNGENYKKHVKKASTMKANGHVPQPSISRGNKRQKTDELKTPEPQEAAVVKKTTPRGKTPQPASKRDDYTVGGNEDEEIYCFCRGVSHGEMIGCDGDECQYEWFHFKCVGLTAQPEGEWFCPDCTKKELKKSSKKEKKKKKN